MPEMMATLARSTCSSFLFQEFRRNGGIKMVKANLSDSKSKKANLSAAKNERIKLPVYSNSNGGSQETFHISKFLSHPSGVEAILNKRALQSLQSLNSNLYRCTLPQIQFLNFEVAPVLILQVIPSTQDCRVEMLSCQFEGSEVVERQNEHFSASMQNYITWETIDSEPFLNIDVKLNLTLEIYTQPLTLLPVSAVEHPGNKMMQALVDRLVPLLLQQLLQDYDEWVRHHHQHLSWNLSNSPDGTFPSLGS